ncbi:hypothetical protein KFK09_020969 [Dendrobium nobile]|uniref:Uncharacterized protein n=1 Tax=Dendrobium nobile TaxID=94219 RepID=A0A8T3AUH5_DENNO|nr:hypothetical protein KFK09_020969 [Dendrobium nobile]
MVLLAGFLVICLTLGWFWEPGTCEGNEFRRAFPVVEPDFGHTKLRLAREGLEAIRRIRSPIAAVADKDKVWFKTKNDFPQCLILLLPVMTWLCLEAISSSSVVLLGISGKQILGEF